MSRVLRILLGYLFPALLLHGEYWGGWMGGRVFPTAHRLRWESRSVAGDTVRPLAQSSRCAEPLPPATLTVVFAAAVFFLEGCEPRPDTFYLSHP